MMRRRTMQDMTANCDGMQNQRRDNSRSGWLHNEITTTTTSAENAARSNLVSMDHDLWGGMTMMDEGEEAMVKEETVEKNDVPFDFGDVDSLPLNRNNKNNKSMDLNTSSMQKRVNARTIINNSDNVDEREINKRRSNDDEGMNNTTLSSSFLPIGKVARLEPSEGSAFRRVDAAMSLLSCDGWDREDENERRLDGGFVLCGVKREKMDELERMSENAAATTINNNNENLLSSSMTRNDNSEIVYATRGSESSRFDSSLSSSSQAIQPHHNENDVNANQTCVQQNDKERDDDNDDDDDDGSSIGSYHHLDDIEQESAMDSDNDFSLEDTRTKENRRRNETHLDQNRSSNIVVSSASSAPRVKPHGYWNDFSNVEKDLRAFIEQMGDKIKLGRMPTYAQLQNGGCSSLATAIQKHGGFAAVRERLGLASAPTKPQGYWSDFSNVEKELRSFIERMGDKIEPGRMPTYTQLLDAGCSSLIDAIRKHGGFVAVAERLALTAAAPTKPQGYWSDFSNVEKEIRSFIERMGDKIEPGMMPTFTQFQNGGCIVFEHAIRKHGGSAAVGERLGLAASSSKLGPAAANIIVVCAEESRSSASAKKFSAPKPSFDGEHPNACTFEDLESVSRSAHEKSQGYSNSTPNRMREETFHSKPVARDADTTAMKLIVCNSSRPSSEDDDGDEIVYAARSNERTRLDCVSSSSSLQTAQSQNNENAANMNQPSVEQSDEYGDNDDDDDRSSIASFYHLDDIDRESTLDRDDDVIDGNKKATTMKRRQNKTSLHKDGPCITSTTKEANSRRPLGYWNDFSTVERELRSFIERMGDKIELGRMPTQRQLMTEGCSSLATAIRKHGGFVAVAERLGLASAPTKPTGYWNDFSNVEREIRSFIERMGDKIEPGRMPTQKLLLNQGCGGLINAIKKHGGFAAVGERLSLAVSLSAASENSADDTRKSESGVEFDHANMHQQLTSVTNVNSEVLIGPRLMHPGDCPRMSRLMDEDAVEAINNNSKDNANHPSSLTATHDEREIANASRIGDSTKLDNAKHSSLQTMQSYENENAVNRHESSDEQGDKESDDSDEDGSCDAVVSSAATGPRTKPQGYWDDFSNVEKELGSFIERMGDKIQPGRMPTERQLQNGGCSGLMIAIRQHGGVGAVGERLGLAPAAPTKPHRYWNDFSNVEKEIRSFIERMGDKIKPGRMPTTTQLQNEGCNSLMNAIQKHEGVRAVGERLGLAVPTSTMPPGYSDNFSDVERELRSFIERMGDKIEPGAMATATQLQKEGSNRLMRAICKHGGFTAVGERLGLAPPS